MAAYQEASLTSLACSSSSPPTSSSSPLPCLLALAQRLVHGGLKLEPSPEWLWVCAWSVAEGSAASREYCWKRAMQINRKRAATWAALGRLYALKGASEEEEEGEEEGRTREDEGGGKMRQMEAKGEKRRGTVGKGGKSVERKWEPVRGRRSTLGYSSLCSRSW